MKTWKRALADSIATGVTADLATGAAVALLGRRDSGSAVAPINAASHVYWGDEAAATEQVTLRHTLPGLLINVGAGIWWSLVFQKLFGDAVDRRGLPAAIVGGAATSALAYILDYRILPKRLTPGWEYRLSRRSLFMALAALGAGMAAGALMVRK